jgi:hypothetical protein
MRQRCREATANGSNSPKVHRCVGYLATVHIKLVTFILFRFTPAEVPFSSCGSVAAPRAKARRHDKVPTTHNERRRGKRPGRHDQVSVRRNERRRGKRPWHHDQVLATHSEWRRKQRPGSTIKFPRRTTSGAAGIASTASLKSYRKRNLLKAIQQPVQVAQPVRFQSSLVYIIHLRRK